MLLRLFMVFGMVALGASVLMAEVGPQVLAEGQGPSGPKQPQAFVSTDGLVDVVYAVGNEIRVSTSRDRGATFALTPGVIRCPNLSAGMRRGPRIVRTKSALVVTAIGGKQGKGRDGDLWAWHSTDQGARWSDPVMVNDSRGAAREGLHGMTAGSNGEVWSVWLDLRNGKTEVYAATSRDDGQTWTGNVRVYRSPDGSVCQCCHPSVIGDPRGSVSVLFRNSLGGDRDMFLASSNDGQSFAASRKLGQGSWKLDACPMDGGMVASSDKGEHVTVWRRQDHVYVTSGDGASERDLGSGQQPWVAWSAAGPIVVWTHGREGALSLQTGLAGATRQLAPNARDPVVASHPRSDIAVVCWEAKQGGATTVVAQVIDTPAGTPTEVTLHEPPVEHVHWRFFGFGMTLPLSSNNSSHPTDSMGQWVSLLREMIPQSGFVASEVLDLNSLDGTGVALAAEIPTRLEPFDPPRISLLCDTARRERSGVLNI